MRRSRKKFWIVVWKLNKSITLQNATKIKEVLGWVFTLHLPTEASQSLQPSEAWWSLTSSTMLQFSSQSHVWSHKSNTDPKFPPIWSPTKSYKRAHPLASALEWAIYPIKIIKTWFRIGLYFTCINYSLTKSWISKISRKPYIFTRPTNSNYKYLYIQSL